LQTSHALPQSANTADAISVLLRDLIDYAGLFPPASLAMDAAVANYQTYSQSESNWMLGRFILPVARLNEFEEAFAGLPASTPSSLNWRLSALLGADPETDIARICEFNARNGDSCSSGAAVIDSVEAKAATPAEIARLSVLIPPDLVTYFEIPLATCSECVAAVAACGRRAKVRTGGETPDKFPSAGALVEFMQLCAAAGVPFKATAGLHHPLRSVHRLTYQADGPSETMHGFLNVFLGAMFLQETGDPWLARQLMEEQSRQAFHFDVDGVRWRDYRIGRKEIANARKSFAISFGSCSFTEPIEDLRSLHLL
jgi:hypothetical protein